MLASTTAALRPVPARADRNCMQGTARCRRAAQRPAFSLVELAMVVATIAMIAAVAVPRMSSAAERSRDAALVASTDVLQRALDMYSVEHYDLTAAHLDGVKDTDGTKFVQRLLRPTDEGGNVGGGGAVFGPYLRTMPRNTMNNLATVRVDGPAAGLGTHGWRYDSNANVIEPDDGDGLAVLAARQKGKLGVTLKGVEAD